MDFPTELLTMICRYMTKAELKLCRLIHKPFDRAAVPFLFDEVFFSTTRADFEISRLTVHHFSPYIKTLTFSSVYYPAMSWTNFKWQTKFGKAGGSTTAMNENVNEHLKLGYQNHCRLHKEQEEDLESGVIFAHLCSTLQRAPSLQSIIVSDIGSCRKDKLRGQGFWNSVDTCSVQYCIFSDYQHVQYQHLPISGFASATANPWHLVMLAMWATQSSITDVTVSSSRDTWAGGGLPIGALASAVQRPYAINDVLQKLTRLDLSLRSRTTADERYFQEARVARTLSFATNLRYLSIKFSDVTAEILQTTIFHSCLGGCRFARLMSLELCDFSSTSEELFQFFDSSPNLEALHFYSHRLTSGTWEAAANRIRTSFRLKSVYLTGLSGGWIGAWAGPIPEYFHYYNRAGYVEDFFLKDGENPFSEAALQRDRNEDESDSD